MSGRYMWNGSDTAASNAGDSASIPAGEAGNKFQVPTYSFYVSGNYGGVSATVKLLLSPDSDKVDDASSRWFSPTGGSFSGTGAIADAMINVEARFRKSKVNVTGGDGTTAIKAEMV